MAKSFYNTENNFLGGVLFYTCIQQPVTKYESADKEWKVTVAVDEDTADIWNERHPKQEAKAVLTSKFKDIYGVDAPFEGKKQYLITVRKDEKLANGKEVPEQYQPKVFITGSNGKVVDVTKSKLVGNGSEGVISLDIYENKYGCFARLKNVKVEVLLEYVVTSGGVAGSEFGEVENSGEEFEEQAEPQEQPKSSGKPKKQTKAVEPDDDDAPF